MAEKNFTQIQSVLTMSTTISLAPDFSISPGWLQWPSHCSSCICPSLPQYILDREMRGILLKQKATHATTYSKPSRLPTSSSPHPSSCVVSTPVISLTPHLSPGGPPMLCHSHTASLLFPKHSRGTPGMLRTWCPSAQKTFYPPGNCRANSLPPSCSC